MQFKGEIIIDKDFSVNINTKTFRYNENEISKSLSIKNIVSCEVYADMSVIKSVDIKAYLQTSYGAIPFFDDSSELIKKLSSAGSVLVIYFKDETGATKFYRKRYGKEDVRQYEHRWLINKIINEEAKQRPAK